MWVKQCHKLTNHKNGNGKFIHKPTMTGNGKFESHLYPPIYKNADDWGMVNMKFFYPQGL
jgi:hypothetical protein